MTPPTVTPRPASRRVAERHSRQGNALPRLGASLLTLLLLALPPLVLLQVTGNPLRPPAALRGSDALLHQIDDAAVVYIVATLAWLWWLHLLGCFVTQALQQARGSRARMPWPRLLFGANTLIASNLVAVILMSGSGSSLTPAPQKPSTVVTWQHDEVVSNLHPSPPPGARTLDLTADVAPSTSPAGRPEETAKVSSAGSAIRCRVLPPHGRHHDTLWDIAERHLGDGMRWRDIFALNEGRVMPDGQRLTRASLIRPGWILHLPADARSLPIDQVAAPDASSRVAVNGPGDTGGRAATTAHSDAAHLDTAHSGTMRQPSDTSDRSTAGSGMSQRFDLPPHQATPASPVPPALSEPQTSAHTPASQVSQPASTAGAAPSRADDRPSGPASHEPEHVGHDSHVETAGELGLLGLAGLGLLAALTRRRKVAARRRPRGARPATPASELLQVEAQLRREARSAQDLSATLRLALLLAARHDPERRLTEDLVAVWHHPDDSFELVLADGDADRTATTPGAESAGAESIGVMAPAPFVATGRGWLLPVEGRRFLFATTRTKSSDDRLREELEVHDDPFPLLLPVGAREGSTCLVNLGHAPVVSLDADQVVDAGHASEQDTDGGSRGNSVSAVLAAWVLQLAGAPWAGNSRILLAPPYADLAGSLPALSVAGPDDLTRLASAASSDGVLGEEAELLAGFRPDQLPATTFDLARGDTALAVLLDGQQPCTDPAAAATPDVWRLQPDGTVSIPGIADGLVPTRVEGEQLELVRRLLEHAQDPPHAAASDPGRRSRALETPPTPLPPATALPTALNTARPTAASSGDTAAVADDPEFALPEPGEERLAVPPVVRVDVLGPVMMTGTSSTLGGTLRQILLFLAMHRRPVPPLALWEAVWPDREFNDHSLRSRCNELKRYLHRQLLKDGRSWVLPASVRCDWQEFKALAAGSHDDKITALALVRGRPFEDFAPDWIHLEGIYAEIEATIVDLALEVASDALERGDTMTASFAAAAGAKASPYEERLVQLGIRAAQDRGAYSLARSLHRQLTAVLDDEIEPDDTELPATTQLMADLNYNESRQLRQAQRGSDS